MSPNLWGGGYIDFGADPIGVGIGIGISISISISISVTLSCLYNILVGFLPNFHWLHNRDIIKTLLWLDYGDLDQIFKVTAVEKGKIHGWGTFVFSENIVSNFSCHQNITNFISAEITQRVVKLNFKFIRPSICCQHSWHDVNFFFSECILLWWAMALLLQ